MALRKPRRLVLERLEDRTTPATFVVTNTLDDGNSGSLRWAINQANADTDPLSNINFNIPGSGLHTISTASSLPTITHATVIDGYSQPGASANTLAVGDDAVLKIAVQGGQTGIAIASGGCTIQGLL